MHGLIFAELQKYAETKHGKGTWQALLKKAGLETKVYLAIQEYRDAEVVALVVAASSMTGLPVAEVLEDFGEFIVPDLVKMYGHLLRQNGVRSMSLRIPKPLSTPWCGSRIPARNHRS